VAVKRNKKMAQEGDGGLLKGKQLPAGAKPLSTMISSTFDSKRIGTEEKNKN